jgi:hypothetical protein
MIETAKGAALLIDSTTLIGERASHLGSIRSVA